MASEGQDQLKATETIPGEVQNRILALCGTAGMAPDQLSILHQVLRNYDNPELPETVATLGQHSGVPEETRDEFRNALRNV